MGPGQPTHLNSPAVTRRPACTLGPDTMPTQPGPVPGASWPLHLSRGTSCSQPRHALEPSGHFRGSRGQGRWWDVCVACGRSPCMHTLWPDPGPEHGQSPPGTWAHRCTHSGHRRRPCSSPQPQRPPEVSAWAPQPNLSWFPLKAGRTGKGCGGGEHTFLGGEPGGGSEGKMQSGSSPHPPGSEACRALGCQHLSFPLVGGKAAAS